MANRLEGSAGKAFAEYIKLQVEASRGKLLYEAIFAQFLEPQQG